MSIVCKIFVTSLIFLVVCLLIIDSIKNPDVLNPVFAWSVIGLAASSAMTAIVTALICVWTEEF